MNPDWRIVLGTASLSAIVSYVWWSRFRVWALRQDLFAIRDELWDRMRASGRLDDPGHRRFRHALNAMIRLAPDLTLLTVWRMVVSRSEILERSVEVGQGIPLAKEVRHAREQAAARVVNYLLFQSISGLTLVAVARGFRFLSQNVDWLSRKIQALFDSRLIADMGDPSDPTWARSGV